MAVTVGLCLIATPYCYSYDMPAAAAGLAVAGAKAFDQGLRFGDVIGLSFAWAWPGFTWMIGLFQIVHGCTQLSTGAVALVMMVLVCWRRLGPVTPSRAGAPLEDQVRTESLTPLPA